MGYISDDAWSNLPGRIFIFIAQSFGFLGDYLRLWRNSVSELEKPCLPPTSLPFFKDVATGAILSDCDYDSNNKHSDIVEKQDSGYDFDNWSNLPPEILVLIVQKFSFLREYYRFISVCKSWRDSVSIFKKPCLPLTGVPFLLLAEDVAPGAMLEYDPSQDYSHVEDSSEDDDDSGIDDDEDSGKDDDDCGDDDDEEDSSGDDDDEEDSSSDDDEEDNGSGDDDEEEDGKKDYIEEHKYDHDKNSVGSSRGLYSLITGQTYSIDLPEAAGRLILGTNKGWLVTLGRDLQINLLHPLTNHQIPLPNMLTFPPQKSYSEDYPPEEDSDMFISKVVLSSNILDEKTTFGFYHHRPNPSPIVMVIYGPCSLGFARLGNKVWTDVSVSSSAFDDIVYHKGNFFAVDCHGGIFVCGISDEGGGDIQGKKIESLKTNDWDKKYLVESTSGSGLLLLVRYRKELRFKYRTIGFSVWRLDIKYSDSFEDVSCTLKEEEEKDLGNEAIFIGNASSTAVSSSEIIKPNCIFFTDDNMEGYCREGGGHDMGIFSIEHHTIEPHFQGKSMHPIAPPLWYI